VREKTEQEEFWAGEFGDGYIVRNESPEKLASNLTFLSRALKGAGNIESCVEFGANIGLNLRALKLLYPQMQAYGVEINAKASEVLSGYLGEGRVFNGSLFDFEVEAQFQLALIRGVMIHINPNMLQEVYNKIYEASSDYILVIEYYNPTPTEVNYRGHSGKLFKRDFAGEMLDKFSNLKLVDYGFGYHRDSSLLGKVDDGTWFLLQKHN